VTLLTPIACSEAPKGAGSARAPKPMTCTCTQEWPAAAARARKSAKAVPASGMPPSDSTSSLIS
jgi:hypothetical protein